MKFLAWDTSSHFGAICAVESAREGAADAMPQIRAEFALGVEAAHSERLLWAIHQTLEACRWKLSDVDVFGVGVGPGSFTGLRIGITTARTLAHTLAKPLVGFSSMAALVRPMAETLAVTEPKTWIFAQTDACKGEWFTLMGPAKEILLCRNDPLQWRKAVKEQVQDPQAALKAFSVQVKKARGKWAAFGDDLSDDALKALPKKSRVQLPKSTPLRVIPRYAGILTVEAFQHGHDAKTQDPLAVHPRYLRVADAEKNLKEGRLKKNAPTRNVDLIEATGK
ncbi:MAG: tRNA (adenosine(37)-N6)-threonylcarbamoyltransferase complex dimerization subunit type 1 TsaB [Bdellovibrionales bacterium]|nr:tRNA (adenosine(37)-N6)-threonylcarbamoyltransferase complex dimerization subunit type 1 TsaB [Bdellovibrionales bacterium]